jgi:hypothetical protein
VIWDFAKHADLLILVGIVALLIVLLSRISLSGVGVVPVVVAGPGGAWIVATEWRIGAFLLLRLSPLWTEVDGINGIFLFVLNGGNPG